MNSIIGICKSISKTFREDVRYYMKHEICKTTNNTQIYKTINKIQIHNKYTKQLIETTKNTITQQTNTCSKSTIEIFFRMRYV